MTSATPQASATTRLDRGVVPFCGLPLAQLSGIPADTAGAIVGVGHSLGSAHDGAENAPFFTRSLSKAHTWAANDPCILDVARRRPTLPAVVDLGDLQFDGLDLAEATAMIRDVVAALPDGVAPCVIGGDHTVCLGVVQALRRRRSEPFWVVQFDQHLDLQIWGKGPYTGREPLFNTNVMSHVADELGAGRLIQLGVSPYASIERAAVDDIARYLSVVGTQVCLDAPELFDDHAFRAVIGTGRDIYVSLDVDVLERHSMSSTSYPADVGLGMRDLLHLLDLVLSDNRLIGFDVVEFAAPREDRTAATLADGGRVVALVLRLLRALPAPKSRAGIEEGIA
jgi:arginase family enzyme